MLFNFIFRGLGSSDIRQVFKCFFQVFLWIHLFVFISNKLKRKVSDSPHELWHVASKVIIVIRVCPLLVTRVLVFLSFAFYVL